jgi:AraC family transcriptional activator of mtrCDE
MDVLSDWMRTMGTAGVLLARTRLAAPWGMRMEASEEVSFHIVVEGGCWLRCKGREPVELLQGDLVVLPTGAAHELVHEPRGRAEPLEELIARVRRAPPPKGRTSLVMCGAYRSDAGLAHPLLRALPPVAHFPAARIRAHAALAATVGLLVAEAERPGPGSDVLVQHLFDALFLYLVRAWAEEDAEARPGWLSALRDEALSRALARMHEKPAAPWTVESLAREAGMSRAVFARRFTQEVGEPPLAYLTGWRMGLASRLLRESEASLAEVASRVGYDSEFAFSRAFKRSRGLAPMAFRRAGVEEMAPGAPRGGAGRAGGRAGARG